MEISIVVPTYNRRPLLLRAIQTLFSQADVSSSFEIIVVIDGSADGTAEALRTISPPVPLTVIEQPNRGPSAARNSGYRAAQSDLVLFLDDDMQCDSHLVAAHLAAHRRSPNLIAFGAIFTSTDTPPTLAAECFRREIGAFHLQHAVSTSEKWEMNQCVFSNTSLSRKMLVESGGFDETFRHREDLDLGVRLINVGAKPEYVPGAVAYQQYDKTSADLLCEAEAFAEADVMFARKHPDGVVQGQLAWVAQQPYWKRRLRTLLAIIPVLDPLVLAPICSMGQSFYSVPVLRNLGVRALQLRRNIRRERKLRQLAWSPAQKPG